ncbi:RYamide receptor [Caerostris darwini]|uniref:RYamide receptor n=1 Tax=Caerostris darwini TaxID=1538125 RepID=A0AAV4UBE5_9ARAC|nr:RYamide receptor [Caerostris darwini]
MLPMNITQELIGNNSEKNDELDPDSELSVSVPKTVEAVMHIMYITVSVAAVGGNGMVCYIVLAYQRMRTVTNFFIINLAVGDILMACLCIPFGFVSNLLLQYWPFGAVMCVLVSYAQVVSVFISAYTLIAISIDRYIAILYPLRPRMTKLQAKLIIVLVWVVALITPLPTAVLSRLEIHPAWDGFNDTTRRYICTEAWETSEQRYYYSMALMILQYFFPLIVLLYTYTRIAIVVWGNKPPGEAEDVRDQRLAASKRKNRQPARQQKNANFFRVLIIKGKEFTLIRIIVVTIIVRFPFLRHFDDFLTANFGPVPLTTNKRRGYTPLLALSEKKVIYRRDLAPLINKPETF